MTSASTEAPVAPRNLTVLVALGAAFVTACTQCSSGTPKAGPDAAPPHPDASVADTGGLDTSWWDGGPVSDWSGWRRLTEIDPNCVLDVPLDVTTALPTINWVPCDNGNAACKQINTTGWTPNVEVFRGAAVSPNADKFMMLWARAPIQQDNEFEWDVYSLPAFTPLAAWRQRYGGLLCAINVGFTPNEIVTIYKTNPGPKTEVGSAQTLMTSPMLTAYSPDVLDGTSWDSFAASDTTIAFRIAQLTRIVRAPVGAPTYTNTQGMRLAVPQVFGNDVFAWNEYGSGDGWSRVVRVNADGSTTPFIAAPQKQVSSGAASDGKTWYWSYSYGSTDPATNPQPTTEIWTAAYTNDPTTLAATQTKVLTMPSGASGSVNGVAIGGYYAFQVTQNETYTLQGATGKVQTVGNFSNRRCWNVVWASPSELWCIEQIIPGPDGVAFTRTALAPW